MLESLRLREDPGTRSTLVCPSQAQSSQVDNGPGVMVTWRSQILARTRPRANGDVHLQLGQPPCKSEKLSEML